MSQFLDPNSQQLVAARFNAQHAANLVATTSHFADQFGVADPSQFVTVVQQQQNTATQQFHNVANNFNFFQQPQNLAVVSAPTAASSAPTINMTSRRHAQGQSHMDQLVTHQAIDQTGVNQHHLLDHNQQLTCVNPMNADNLSNHLANGSSFIFDQTNGVIRIPHTSVLDASNAIVVNTITSSLRQQQQQQQHQHQLQQNQNYQQHNNSLSANPDGTCQQNPTNHHRSGSHASRVNRSDENGHKRSDGGNLASQTLSNNVGGGGGSSGRSPNKSGAGLATNQTRAGDSSKSKCSRSSKGGNKTKVQKPDKNPDPNRRTFACPTCGKGFTENFNMKRHMQIHSQSRPKFTCNECPKSFAWKDNFVRHKKAAHENVIESFPLQ